MLACGFALTGFGLALGLVAFRVAVGLTVGIAELVGLTDELVVTVTGSAVFLLSAGRAHTLAAITAPKTVASTAIKMITARRSGDRRRLGRSGVGDSMLLMCLFAFHSGCGPR